MALAYPEGECFFRRSALKNGFYSADRVDQFYGHFLVEFLWNVPIHTGPQVMDRHYHPRSSYKRHDFSQPGHPIYGGGRKGPYIGNWSQIAFVYGSHYHKGKHRRVQHNLCTYDERLKKQVNGDAMESWFMVMPIPKRQEGWVFIDRVASIRAIYIPVAHQASEDHPELCTFQHVNFASADAKVKIYRHDGNPKNPKKFWNDVTLHKTYGLKAWTQETLGININGLVNLLSLPRQLRAQNAFTSKNIMLVGAAMVATPPVERSFDDQADFDWAKVAGANFGLAIQWKPAPKKQDWLENFVKNSLTIAIGFIPGVGPIAAIAFPLIWTAIADPDSFVDTWRNLCPGVDLQLKVLEAIRDSAKQTREYLPEGWENSALGPKFLAPRNPGGVHAMAALTSDSGDNDDTEARGLVASDDFSTDSLINNELKSVVGENVDYKSLVAEAGRPEEEIIILEAEKDRMEGIDLDAEDNRLEDEIGDEGIPDRVTLDEIGPNLYFRLTEQVLKETATKEEESEWAKLVETAVDTAKDIVSKLPTLPGLGGKQETTPVEEVGEDPTKSDGPVNSYDWMDTYLAELFSGKLTLEESK